MPERRTWSINAIVALPIGELDWAEVKGRRGVDLSIDNVRERDVRNNLSKAASAIANTGGGALLLGFEDPTKAGNWKVDDGGISADIRGGTREWLEDLLPTLVTLPLRRLNVFEFAPNNGPLATGPGRAVYVVDIPDSEIAPHQALDNRYYIRVAGKSRPANHRIVLDILNRRRDPTIEPEFEFELDSHTVTDDPMRADLLRAMNPGRPESKTVTTAKLLIRGRNVGRVLANHVCAFFEVPAVILPKNDHTPDSGELQTFIKDNTRRDVVDVDVLGPGRSYYKYGPSWFDPILPSLSHVWEIELDPDVILKGFSSSTLEIQWTSHADNAAERSGAIPLANIHISDKRPAWQR